MTNVNTLYWQDVNTGIAATCDTSNGTGKTIPGDLPDTPPPAVSTIELINSGDTGTCDGNCVTWSALTAAFEPIGLPWPFVAETEGASHLVSGKIKNVKVQVTESSDCAYQITGPGGDPGELSAEYDSGQFSILYDGGNSLEVTATNGILPCEAMLINVADPFIFDGIFQFSPPASIHHDH